MADCAVRITLGAEQAWRVIDGTPTSLVRKDTEKADEIREKWQWMKHDNLAEGHRSIRRAYPQLRDF